MPFCKLPDETVVLSIYDSNEDDYCLTNYSEKPGGGDYVFSDPDLGNVNCKSGEIFLQSQKISNRTSRKSFIDQANINGSDWARTKVNNFKPHRADWTSFTNGVVGYKEQVQLAINTAKAAQSGIVRDYLTYCGQHDISIVEDTAGADYGDPYWGAGPDGKGTNILGNALTATSALLINPSLGDSEAYAQAKNKWSQVSPSYQVVAPGRYARQKGEKAVLMQNLPQVKNLGNLQRQIQQPLQPSPSQSPPRVQNLGNLQQQIQQPPQPLPSQAQHYYYSQGGNQRLIIGGNRVLGAEYSNDNGATWMQSNDLGNHRIKSLVDHYYASNPQDSASPPQDSASPPQGTQHHYSQGGNIRLIIGGNRVLGAEYTNDNGATWMRSTDLGNRRIKSLVDNFEKQFGKQIEKQGIYNNYQYASFYQNAGRSHAFEASVDNFKGLKSQYQNQRGDYLKTSILDTLKDKIDNCGSTYDLNALKDNIYKSDEYKVLKKGQGIVTLLTGIKTSSVKALEDMFDQKAQKINEDQAAAQSTDFKLR